MVRHNTIFRVGLRDVSETLSGYFLHTDNKYPECAWIHDKTGQRLRLDMVQVRLDWIGWDWMEKESLGKCISMTIKRRIITFELGFWFHTCL